MDINQAKEDLIKKSNEGVNIYKLFLEAVALIAEDTNDEFFEEQVKENIKTIYGYALKEEGAEEVRKEEILEKIKKLEAVQDKAQEESDRRRILNSIIFLKQELK